MVRRAILVTCGDTVALWLLAVHEKLIVTSMHTIGFVTLVFVRIDTLVWQMPKKHPLLHPLPCKPTLKDARLPKRTWTSVSSIGDQTFLNKRIQKGGRETFAVNPTAYPFRHAPIYTNMCVIRNETFHSATMTNEILQDYERYVHCLLKLLCPVNNVLMTNPSTRHRHMTSMRSYVSSRLMPTKRFVVLRRYRPFAECAVAVAVLVVVDVAFAPRVVVRTHEKYARIGKRVIRFHRLNTETGTTTMMHPRSS